MNNQDTDQKKGREANVLATMNDINRDEAIKLFEKAEVKEFEVRDLLDRCFCLIRNQALAGEIGAWLPKEEWDIFSKEIRSRVADELRERGFIVSCSDSCSDTLKIYWLTER